LTASHAGTIGYDANRRLPENARPPAAQSLSVESGHLKREVDKFLQTVRAA